MGAESKCTLIVGRTKAEGKALLERSAAISEADVMKAGQAAGLVDVKVVRFSDTHTAAKYVIPVKNR